MNGWKILGLGAGITGAGYLIAVGACHTYKRCKNILKDDKKSTSKSKSKKTKK